MFCCLSCLLLLVAVPLLLVKIYIKLWTRRNGSYVCLVGKTALITGANTGLGYATAIDFAQRGARVILACRSKEKAENAVKAIIRATDNPNVLYKLVDFSSLQSVRDFAEDINRSEDRLDILVNNAGIILQKEDFTSDGIQTILHVNHISPFLLTHLLLDKLKKSAPSRIVNVASEAARISKVTVQTLDGLNAISSKYNFVLYGNSKLCNILFTTELAKKLRGTGVTVNAVHPGAVYTDLAQNSGKIVTTLYNTLGKNLFQTPEEGAQTQIYVAVSKEVEDVSGKLFYVCRQIEAYDNAKDEVLARLVWEKSEEWAKLHKPEKIQ